VSEAQAKSETVNESSAEEDFRLTKHAY